MPKIQTCICVNLSKPIGCLMIESVQVIDQSFVNNPVYFRWYWTRIRPVA